MDIFVILVLHTMHTPAEAVSAPLVSRVPAGPLWNWRWRRSKNLGPLPVLVLGV